MYYPLDDPAGSATVANIGSAGSAFDGSVRGGATLGQPGALLTAGDTAIAFDGSSGYVFIPAPGPSFPPITTFSIEAWFNASSTWTGTGYAASLFGVPGGFGLSAGKPFGVVVDTTGTSHQVTASRTYNDGNWHHMVMTDDGTSLTLYLDGSQASQIVIGAPVTYNGSQAGALGSNGSGAFFQGLIDEAAGYSYALSPTQVAAHYAAARASLTLSPPTQTGGTGTFQTVIATLLAADGTPVPNAEVDFSITNGPNTGETGSGITNGEGIATWTYTSQAAGTDIVEAAVPKAPGGSLQATQPVYVTWTIKPGLVAFGDSVAAGYGLGMSEGFNCAQPSPPAQPVPPAEVTFCEMHGDNPDAYPALVAQALGGPFRNYAVQGECASSSDCPGQTESVDKQIQHAHEERKIVPSVITLTVGADDIKFGDCLKAALDFQDPSFPDFFLQKPKDPCNPTSLAENLAKFQQSLTEDLQTIGHNYPFTPILVTDYYNPFPKGPSESEDPCPLDNALTILTAHAQGQNPIAILTAYFWFHDRFLDESRSIQTAIYGSASRVVEQLNRAINAAVATAQAEIGATITVVPVDFVSSLTGARHDMCAQGSEWAFSPTVRLDLQLDTRFGPLTDHLSFGGDDLCPDPVAPDDKTRPIHFAGKGFRVTGFFAVNCLPHPTWDGQKEIASDLEDHLSLSGP